MNSPIVLLMASLVVLVILGEGRAPVLHRVGGDKHGWRVNINFTDWASHEHFYVGDWLYFGFDKHTYSVLEVNKTAYKNCMETNFMTNITRGGRDVFNLTVARPYFFISGRGFCFRGVKLAITVVDAPPDSSPNSNNSTNSLFKTITPDDDGDSDDATTSTLFFHPLLLALALAFAAFVFI